MSLETKLLTIADNEQKVYDAGKKAKSAEFWGNIQQNGNRKSYQGAFSRWSCEEILPQYTITTNTLYELFYGCENLINFSWDMIKPLNNGFMSAYYFVRGCSELKSVDMDLVFNKYTASTVLLGSFMDATSLERIQKIYSKADMLYTNTFYQCTKLKDIVFEGEIGKSIDFFWSPLSLDSMKSIIMHLVNYKDTVYDGGYTLTFSSDRWLLLDNEGTTSPNGNSWKEYVSDLGWVAV